MRQAEQIRRALAERSEAVVQRLESALKHIVPLVQQVITQTERRVLHGESVPASAKLVSLFEPHTAIVRRGKAHVPAEFGRKVVLDEVDGGLVTRYVVLVGNPPEAPELPTAWLITRRLSSILQACSPQTAPSPRSRTSSSHATSTSAPSPYHVRDH